MALSSARKTSTVDPSKGRYVEMEGVMEVRYSSEDVDLQPENEDFYHFQERMTDVPEDFCHKNRQTTVQAYFFCMVCDCDLKSIKSLKDHVIGNKHIRKACEKKRIIFDLPTQPKNAPRIKKLKKEQPRIDLNKSLEERLRESAQPAIGLHFVQEFRNPNDRAAHRMYTCTLPGCKSAWGNSDDMFNHVIKYKHSRNFFKYKYPDDSRISGLSNAEILHKATQVDEEEGGSDDRDYGVIVVIKEYEMYKELKERPDDWSERKAKLGLVGQAMNSNMEPLGKFDGQAKSLGKETNGSGGASTNGLVPQEDRKSRKRAASPSIFNKEMWKNWRPESPRARCQQWMDALKRGVTAIAEEAEEFEGKRDSREYTAAITEINHYLMMMDLDQEDEDFIAPPEIGHENYCKFMDNMYALLNKAKEDILERTDGEEMLMKHVGKVMSEVEEEMERYHASRDSRKYKNIQSRLSEMTKELEKLKPSPGHEQRKKDFNDRLGNLWKQFEELSNEDIELSTLLERQMEHGENHGKSKGEQRKQAREMAVEAFNDEIRGLIRHYLDRYQSSPYLKIGDNREFEALAEYIRNKISKEEVNKYGMIGLRWEDFHVNAAVKDAIQSYIYRKMDKYVSGSIFSNN